MQSHHDRRLMGIGSLIVASVTVIGLGIAVPGAGAATLSAPTTAPITGLTTGPTVAPYLELSGPNPGNLSAGIDAGLGSVTAAFVIGKGCTPTWDDGTPVSKDAAATAAIQQAQAKGAQIIVSFGGAGGTELARSCSNLTHLVAAYQAVISRFSITQIDFDVEGVSIDPKSQKASIARRFSAIRQLESADPNLTVSATIGVGTDGLPKAQMSFLEVAKRSGTRIDLVNIMAMDYGGPISDMGATAIQAAKDTLRQLQTVWPSSTYADLGITPMIGDNDSASEVTTLQNAAAIESFAASNGVGRLAFWSLNRDQQCAGEHDSARNGCSGVQQSPLEFTKTFLGEARPR